MVWQPVRAGRDHLGQFSNQGAVDALTELVWNSLDAEADEVDVVVETQTMGPENLRYVTRLVVSDNGHGMSHEQALSAFASLGDSWKKTLKGRTVNGKRALHGRQGRGRFYVYSLGGRARWSSVTEAGDDRSRVEIVGEQSKIDGFTVDDPVRTDEPVGTRVVVFVEQGRSLTQLLREDLRFQLAARLAAHLLANEDIVVRVNGEVLDARSLIEGEPEDVVVDETSDAQQPPTLTIVDWTEEMRRAPGLVLCNENGMALLVLDKPASSAAVKSTGYLKWSGFGQNADLTLATMQYPDLIAEATRLFEQHVKARLGAVTATVVSRLIDEGIYPYATVEIDDPIKRTERDMFDLVAVTARSTLSAGNRQQREMSARLLKLALEERPEGLDKILSDTLDLTAEDRDQLADMLRYSSLGRIVGAATEVTRRLDLLSTLRHHIYGAGTADKMREVDQLHPLIRDNTWIFGEDWHLSRSEASLTKVLRDNLHDEALLEAQLAESGGEVRRSDGRTGRLDLVLQRTIRAPGQTARLVVELKRPRCRLGERELSQIRSYARALSQHFGMGPSKWTFLLVGSTIDENAIGDQINQSGRARGLLVQNENYEVWVATWGELIDRAERRLDFYRVQLQYDISQESAVDRVRSRHSALLPPELVED